MNKYIINRNKDNKGYNEVHTTSCPFKPESYNQVELGYFSNAIEAVKHAKLLGYNADGCFYCCKEAHRG